MIPSTDDSILEDPIGAQLDNEISSLEDQSKHHALPSLLL
jgi:central kinetochore subunit Mal2/MCM21